MQGKTSSQRANDAPVGKPFYRKKRYAVPFVCLCLALAAVFWQIPSSRKITPQTFWITEPLLLDGTGVDYSAAFEKRFGGRYNASGENNGYALLLKSMGAALLEKDKRESYERICEGLGVACDCLDSAPFCDYKGLRNDLEALTANRLIELTPGFDPDETDLYFAESDVANSDVADSDVADSDVADSADDLYSDNYVDKYLYLDEYLFRLSHHGWSRETDSEALDWFEKYDPLFAVLGKAVRQPLFQEGLAIKQGSCLAEVTLPLSAGLRSLSRDLSLRIGRFAHSDDPVMRERALDELETAWLLGRRLSNRPFLLCALLSHSFELNAISATAIWLESGAATEPQLVRFADFLNSLPDRQNEDVLCATERYFSYAFIQHLFAGITKEERELTQLIELPMLPRGLIDENVIRLEYGRYWDSLEAACRISSPMDRSAQLAELDQQLKTRLRQLEKGAFFRILTVRGRSQIQCGALLQQTAGPFFSVLRSRDRVETQYQMTRIAVALERSRLKYGAYPEKLEVLIPEFLPTIPIDPSMGYPAFVYRPIVSVGESDKREKGKDAPGPVQDKPISPRTITAINEEGATFQKNVVWQPFLLYSYGTNREDDGGRPALSVSVGDQVWGWFQE